MNKILLIRIISLFFVIAICITIFVFSNQVGEVSGELSDKTLEVISENTDIIENSSKVINWRLLIRKIAHVLEYFGLSIFVFIFVFTFNLNKYVLLSISFSFSLLYAISDEIHQLFVIGRAGQVQDVLVDLIGIALANAVGFVIFNVIKNKKMKQTM